MNPGKEGRRMVESFRIRIPTEFRKTSCLNLDTQSHTLKVSSLHCFRYSTELLDSEFLVVVVS